MSYHYDCYHHYHHHHRRRRRHRHRHRHHHHHHHHHHHRHRRRRRHYHYSYAAPVTSCTISQNDVNVDLVTTTENQITEILCTAAEARPPVEIQWYHTNKEGVETIIIQGVSQTNVSNPDGTFDTVSTLQYNASKEYNGGTLRCVTRGQEVAESREDAVTLNIKCK